MIQGETGAHCCYAALAACRDHGTSRAPRGMATRDLGPAAVVLQKPYHATPVGFGRPSLSPAIGVAEGLFLVAGRTDAELLTTLSPFFGELLDSRGEVDGAYGPRARAGLATAVEKLRVDPDTRQAVALIWNERDPLPESKDVPCTVSLTLFTMNERVHLHAAMRSSDAWLGLPYDLMQFSTLQLSVANSLGRTTGPLTVTTTSLHLYERDLAAVAATYDPEDDANSWRNDGPWSWPSFGVGQINQDWVMITARAEDLLYNRPPEGETPSERRMRSTLRARLDKSERSQ